MGARKCVSRRLGPEADYGGAYLCASGDTHATPGKAAEHNFATIILAATVI
jgi:hypothetical protein